MIFRSKLTRLSLLGLVLACPVAYGAEDPEVIRLNNLDKACADARVAKLTPIRAQMVEKCVTEEKRNRTVCEAEMSTYGNGNNNRLGAPVNVMFLDLPECVNARQQRDAYLRKLSGR
jgi:hypothetical protein